MMTTQYTAQQLAQALQERGPSQGLPQTIAAPSGGWYDPAKVAAAQAAQGKGADGRTILNGKNLLSILNTIQAPRQTAERTAATTNQNYQGDLSAAGVRMLEGDGNSPAQYVQDVPASFGEYQSDNGQILHGVDGAQFGDPNGQYYADQYDNPTGNGKKDQAHVTYKIVNGQAIPVATDNAYNPSGWVDGGRDAAILAAIAASVGTAGYFAAGAGAAGTGGAGVAGGSAATGNMALIDSGLGTAGYGGSSAGTIALGDVGGAAGATGGAVGGGAVGGGGVGGTGASSAGITQLAPVTITGAAPVPAAGLTLGEGATLATGAAGAVQAASSGTPDYSNEGRNHSTYQADSGGPGTPTKPPTNNGSWGDLLKSAVSSGLKSGSGGGSASDTGNLLTAGLGVLGSAYANNKAGDLNTPNYAGAAQAQAASGRMDQSNAHGNLTYTQNGTDAQGNPVYKQTVSLNPADQANLDAARSGQSSALFGLNNSISGYADALKKLPGLYGNAGSQEALAQQARDSMYHQQTALLDPQYQENQRQLQSQLANQGVVQGSQAYNQAMDSFARQRDYAYGNARDSSINQGNSYANQLFNQNLQAHNTGMQDLSTQQNQYLNTANGLSHTVNEPNFQATPSPTNYLGAAALQGQGNLQQYNSRVGQANSTSNGLFQLGTAAVSNPYVSAAIGSGAKTAGDWIQGLFSTGGGG